MGGNYRCLFPDVLIFTLWVEYHFLRTSIRSGQLTSHTFKEFWHEIAKFDIMKLAQIIVANYG